MTRETVIWAIIAGMGVTNLIVRLVPLVLVSRASIPAVWRRWLSFVPVSVMATLVASEIARPGGRWLPLTRNPHLLAALVTAVVFHRSRNLLLAVLTGMAAFLVFGALLG